MGRFLLTDSPAYAKFFSDFNKDLLDIEEGAVKTAIEKFFNLHELKAALSMAPEFAEDIELMQNHLIYASELDGLRGAEMDSADSILRELHAAHAQKALRNAFIGSEEIHPQVLDIFLNEYALGLNSEIDYFLRLMSLEHPHKLSVFTTAGTLELQHAYTAEFSSQVQAKFAELLKRCRENPDKTRETQEAILRQFWSPPEEPKI